MYRGSQFASILLRIIASVFISGIGPYFFFFFIISLSDFGIWVMVASWNEFKSVLNVQFKTLTLMGESW